MTVRAVFAVSSALTLLAGCGIPVDDRPRALSAEEIPSSLPSSAPPATAQPGGANSVSTTVFFVRESQLAPVRRESPTPPTVEGAIAAVVRGPTLAERSQGLRTALNTQVRLAGTAAARVPLIDLTEAFGEGEGEEQILALAQLVFTLTGLPGVDAVSFARSGQAVEVPTGDGTLKRGPLRRQDFDAVAPPD